MEVDMDTRQLERKSFRNLRTQNNEDLVKNVEITKMPENDIIESTQGEGPKRLDKSVLDGNKSVKDINEEIDAEIKAKVNERINAWIETHGGEVIPASVIMDIQNECVREVNIGYKSIGGLRDQLNIEAGLKESFDANNHERIDRYDGIKRNLIAEGFTEESIDTYVMAINEEMHAVFDNISKLSPEAARKIDINEVAGKIGLEKRVLLVKDNYEPEVGKEEQDDVVDSIIKAVEDEYTVKPKKDIDPFSDLYNGNIDRNTDIVDRDETKFDLPGDIKEIVQTEIVADAEANARLDEMMNFGKNKVLNIDPSKLRGLDPMTVRSMMNRRVGATWRNYLPGSNYYATFVESRDIGKSTQMIELLGGELEGYTKTEEILRLVYNSMEMELGGYVSFEEFLENTADADLDLIYANKAIVDAPRDGDGSTPLIPITGVRCTKCDRSIALVKSTDVEDAKYERYELDIVDLLKRSYPKKLVASRLLQFDTVSRDHSITEARAKVPFGSTEVLQIQDDASLYRFVFSIPSIKRSLKNAGKYRVHMQERTLEKLENEISQLEDKELKNLYVELLELGAEDFSDRMGAFATMLQSKDTDRLMKRRLTKILKYHGEVLDEARDAVEVMQYLSDVYITPTTQYIEEYRTMFPDVSEQDVIEIFALHKSLDKMSVKDGIEIINTLIPGAVYKDVIAKVNEIQKIDDECSVKLILTSDELAGSIVKPDICSMSEEEFIEYCLDGNLNIDVMSTARTHLNENRCQCGCETFTITSQELLFFSTISLMKAESTKKYK